MSFFDEFTQKAKAVAATAQEKAREAADSAKISAAILSEKRELDRNYRTIGQWYVGEHAEVPEAIADVVEAVRESLERIEQLQASRERAENEEAAMEAEEITGTVCPVCGKISSSNFCPNCGAPLEKKEEPAPAEAEDAPKGE
ncbi:MAG: zinc ribbon domain-containing protein [Oscillospiraceae bacterium]|jgi:rubrerythrin|nr:zinc ribbon domain-containing protein [Oscillospiraceae bacterium]